LNLVVGKDDPRKYLSKPFSANKKPQIVLTVLVEDILWALDVSGELKYLSIEGVSNPKNDDTIIISNNKGDIWHNSKELLLSNYTMYTEPVKFNLQSFNIKVVNEKYTLDVHNNKLKVGGITIPQTTMISIPKSVKLCKLIEPTKVVTSWGEQSGNIGDYLCFIDVNDYYILQSKIFDECWETANV